jgi:hypothetical protein
MRFVHGSLTQATPSVVLTSMESSAPPMISSASVFATWRSASRSVWPPLVLDHPAAYAARVEGFPMHPVSSGDSRIVS